MGKKYKKKVQWKQLSLNDLLEPESDKQNRDDCEEEEGDSAPQTPTHENGPYSRHPYKANFANPRRGPPRGFYHANYDRRFDKNFDRYNNENYRNLENKGGSSFEKPYNKPFYERNFHYDKFCGRPPFYGDRNFKFGPGGFVDRGRRPFRPYGRPGGFFSPRGFQGHFQGHFRDGNNRCEGEEDDEEWDDEGILVTEGQQNYSEGGVANGERPSQPVHTVMINNEEYTKIQTPRQEVIFKKSSLDRKRDSIDQGSVTGSVSSGSGSSSTTGGEPGSGSAGSGDQVAGDGSSVSESVEDNSLSVAGDDPADAQQQDQVFEDPNEIFAGEPGGPPLAGVVMQQAYPGGPMITIPVHWTPFIDPTLIPGETALTPLDPAFTHVIDPKALPIDPLHILPVQHDASGCPVHVQVKVDSNGVPIQIQPTAFTVSLSSLHQQQQGIINQQHHQPEGHHLSGQPDVQASQPQPDALEASLQQGDGVADEGSCQEQHILEDQTQEVEQHTLHEQEDRPKQSSSSEQDERAFSPQHEPDDHSCSPNGANDLSCSPEKEVGHVHLVDEQADHECSAIEQEEYDCSSDEQKERVCSTDEQQERDCSTDEQQERDFSTDEQEDHVCWSNELEDHDSWSNEQDDPEVVVVEVERGETGLAEIDRQETEEEGEAMELSGEKETGVDVSDESYNVMVETRETMKTEEEEEEEKEKAEEEENLVVEEEEEEAEDEKVVQVSETYEEIESKEEERQIEQMAETTVEVERDVEVEVEVEVEKEVMEQEEPEARSAEEEEETSVAAIAEEKDTVSNKKTKSKASKDTDTDTTSPSAESSTTPSGIPAVPSTNPLEVTPSPAAESKRRGGSDEEEEEEEVEEEEDMLTKEAEESSDSSDSQYASMSESSSTPTTPAGEPSDGHEAPESQVQSCKTSSDTDASLASPESSPDTGECNPSEVQVDADCTSTTDNIETSETSGVSETEGTKPESEDNCCEAGSQPAEGTCHFPHTPQHATDATEKVLQGYVMVPILTPYYDPSVLYGYPVVVADQQHQHQHEHRGYSKRKKKKYQRRRHAEAQSSGCYLDPQLYTGEPFVATPGGYVVPVEAAPSVCQVHGFQFVTAPFPQHPDEGIIQHSPYLPNVVPDLAAQQAHHLGGTNLDDGSKRVFSDLQEKERRQIQEILQEQRAKVGKSDSTESSDSGVSESEEAVAVEFSSDEQNSNKDQDSLQLSGNTEGTSLTEDASGAQCEVDNTNRVEVSKGFSSEECLERVVDKENSKSEINVPKVANIINAQYELPVGNSIEDCCPKTTNDQNQSICDHDASIQPESELTEKCNITNETDIVNQNSTLNGIQARSNSCTAINSNKDLSAQEQSIPGSSGDVVACSGSATKGSTENLDDLGNKSKLDLILSPKVSCDQVDSFDKAQPTITSHEKQNTETIPQSHITSSTQEDSSSTENLASTSSNAHEPVFSQRVQSLSKESTLDKESLKDLKVTEAVKRWIREVTPEKAFFLSEVQTRLLENEIQGEMDTEDEYIEDELPQSEQSTNLKNSKNVEGNPFAAASSDAPVVGMESCSKRVALSNKQRGISPDTIDEYDGSSTISNLSNEHLYSEASSSQLASFSHSFDDDEVEKYTENPNIYNPVAFAKYYQLGVEVDETTPAATPQPQNCQMSRETTPVVQTESETISECGSEDIETIPHKYDVCQYTATSPMSLATEIFKAEKVLTNMAHISGSHKDIDASKSHFGNPDIYLKHYGNAKRTEISDSGVQSEESSDEMEGRSNVGSSGVGSSLASTPAISPAHQVTGQHSLHSYPLKNLSAGDGPVPCRTVCCAVM